MRTGCVRIAPDTYVVKGVSLDARGRAQAALEWGGDGAVLAGCSAAVMVGARWMEDRPAEVVVPRRARPPADVLVYRDVIPEEEIIEVGGLRCTAPARTAFDLARRQRFGAAIELLDSLFHATGLTAADVEAVAACHPHTRNCRNLPRVLSYVDGGAESIPETRTRLLLQRAGFPKPTTQIRIERDGIAFARIDMGWPRWKVGVEYEGAQHWTTPAQFTHDIDRYHALSTLGWLIIRVSATHLAHPEIILPRISDALHHHGYPR
ncbi:hypothetical protein D7D52_35740 [Nocardia yunnanensis]|uniref:DUF559 domain-containing protein n=1 Tax=Nocardia yunnanensis TaxID=2382165 RepID=A0A386ZL13_9NOCA|nr:hypothetical protein D7D52_35740 [Nocardia yunnanensis]